MVVKKAKKRAKRKVKEPSAKSEMPVGEMKEPTSSALTEMPGSESVHLGGMPPGEMKEGAKHVGTGFMPGEESSPFTDSTEGEMPGKQMV